MDDQAGLLAVLIAIAAAALMYIVAYPYLSGDAKTKKRAAAIVASGKSAIGTSRVNDPAKRRKAIAETLKEFESQNKRKKVTLEQRIAQAGLNWTKVGLLHWLRRLRRSSLCGSLRGERQYDRCRGGGLHRHARPAGVVAFIFA